MEARRRPWSVLGATVLVLLVALAGITTGFHVAAASAASHPMALGTESPPEGEPPASTSAETPPIAPEPTEADEGDGSSVTSDLLFVVLLAGGIVLAAIAVLARKRPRPPRPISVQDWLRRVDQVCLDGRDIVDRAASAEPEQLGQGLSVSQLEVVGGRIEDLVANLEEVACHAPWKTAGQSAHIASTHASLLGEAIEIERQLTLASVDAGDELLVSTARDVATSRVALDRGLRELADLSASAARGPMFGQRGFRADR